MRKRSPKSTPKKGSKSYRIVKMMRDDPYITAVAIAEHVGCSRELVHHAAFKYHMRLGWVDLRNKSGLKALSEDNYMWLLREANKVGAELEDMLDAVITDARLEDET